jgi:type IV secretion system protein VirD4
MGTSEDIQQKSIGFWQAPPKKKLRCDIYTQGSDSHVCTIGPTGSFKGIGAIIPTLLTYPGSAVTIDVTGAAHAVTARRRREMGHRVVVLDPFGVSRQATRDSYNVLNCPVRGVDLQAYAMELAQLVAHQPQTAARNADPFWEHRANGLNAGVFAYLLSRSGKERRSMIEFRDIIMGDDVEYSLGVILDTCGKHLPQLAKRQLASFIKTTDVTRSGILATAAERAMCLFDSGVEEAVATTSFPIEELVSGGPISIYILIPPSRIASHARLWRLWIGSLLSLLQSRKRRPKIPTLFLIDESFQLGYISHVVTAVTLMRNFGTRLWLFFQNLAQIKALYTSWEAIVDNSVVQVLGVNNYVAARALSELTGPSYKPEDLINMSQDAGVCIEKGQVRAFRKINYLKDARFRGLFDDNPLFDLSEQSDISPPEWPHDLDFDRF